MRKMGNRFLFCLAAQNLALLFFPGVLEAGKAHNASSEFPNRSYLAEPRVYYFINSARKIFKKANQRFSKKEKRRYQTIF